MRSIPTSPLEADIIYWEAVYHDGTTISEDNGTYSQIDRSRLASFRLIKGGEIVFEMTPPPGFNGQNLIYRRRTATTGHDRNVLFILGWAPNGTVFAIDPAARTFRVSETGFDPADPQLYPPMAMPGEPDLF